MQKLVLILFIAIFFFDYLAKDLGVAPRLIIVVPEMLSGALFVFLVLRVAHTKTLYISPKYVLLFLFFILIVVSGVILNQAPETTVISGIRFYFKYIPFFILPAVYKFSDEEITLQLKFLLVLGLIQIPITIFQRFVQFTGPGMGSGDLITGTLGISSILSIYLVSVITILLAFYLKKKISAKLALILSAILFFPTIINETKGTVILMPLAMFFVMIYLAKSREIKKKIISVVSVGALFLMAFSLVYDQLYLKHDTSEGLVSFFTDTENLSNYLYREAEFDSKLLRPKINQVVGIRVIEDDSKNSRRFDRMLAPFILMSSEPFKLLFGLGIGNVSESFIGGFDGQYAHLQEAVNAKSTLFSYLVWETGVLGTIIFMIFFILIYYDARKVGHEKDVVGHLAAGWIGVVVVVFFSLFYKNMMEFNSLSYLFWYLSGLIVAKSVLWRRL